MAHAQLYRSMLKQGRMYDAQPWRRAMLLQQAPLLPYTAGQAAGAGHGHALFFLQPPSSSSAHAAPHEQLSVQAIVKRQFRQAAWRKASKEQSLSRGFEVLRHLKTASEPAAPVSSAPTSDSSVSASGLSMNSVGLRRGGFGSSAPPAHTSAPRVPQRSSGLQASGHHQEAGQHAAASSSSSLGEAGGPALQRVLAPRPSAVSTLGRLHQGSGVELQRPKTPPTGVANGAAGAGAAGSVSDAKRDSAYDDAVFQTSVYVSEYLKLVSLAPPSVASRQAAAAVVAAKRSADAAGPPAGSTPTSGVDVYLIEQSRMKHQQSAWRAEVVPQLSASQQRALEDLVRQLGTGVQANRLDEVLDFQTQLCSSTTEPLLARSLLSNNLVLDAWVDFLYTSKSFPALVALVQQRLAAGVDSQRFPLSRASMCKMMAACAVEGEAAASIMVLRESSWASLALPSQHAAAAPEESLHSALNGVPSSVGRLPSWVPLFYSSGAAAADALAPPVTRALEAEEEPDAVLVASGDGFGAEAAQAPVVAPAPVSSAPVSRPRLSISLNARSLYRSPSLSSLLGSSSSLRGSSSNAAQASHLAGMSTRARAELRDERESSAAAAAAAAATAAAEREATPPTTPPTPLPVVDLWTELNVDSRLMELALVAAARSQSRASELEARAAADAIAANAKANPHSEHAEINQSLYEHAQALLAQSRREQQKRSSALRNASSRPHSLAKRNTSGGNGLRLAEESFEEEMEPDSADDEFDFGEAEEELSQDATPTLFQTLNAPTRDGQLPPLAFQLWSLMLQQQVPLSHPHSFMSLVGGLRAHVSETDGSASAPTAAGVMLSTLAAEMAHSRRMGAPLQHKWLRADVAAFRSAELDLHQQLSASAAATDGDASADHAYQCVEVLREMQAEGLPLSSLSSVASLYRDALYDDADGHGSYSRSKLLQDLTVAVEDYSAVDTAVSMDALLDQVARLDDEEVQLAN